MTRISLAFALAAATVTLGIPSNALSDETNNQAQLTTMPSVPDGNGGGTGVGPRAGGKMHLEDVTLGVITDKTLPKLLEGSPKGK